MSLINKMLADLETRAAETQRPDEGKPLIDGLKAANEDSHGLSRARRKWWLLGFAAAIAVGMVQWWPLVQSHITPRLAAWRSAPVAESINASVIHAPPSEPSSDVASPVDAAPTADASVAEFVPVPMPETEPPRVAGLVEFLDEGSGTDDPFGAAELADVAAIVAQPTAPVAKSKAKTTAPSDVTSDVTTGVSRQVLAEAEIRVHNVPAPEPMAPTPAYTPIDVPQTASTMTTKPAMPEPAALTAMPAMTRTAEPAAIAPIEMATASAAAIEPIARPAARVAAPRTMPSAVRAPAPIAETNPSKNASLATAPTLPTTAPSETPSSKNNVDAAHGDEAARAQRHAQLLASEGRYIEAEGQWRAALQHNPLHVEARTQLALFYARQKRVMDAQSLLEEGLTIAPEQLSWRLLLARVYLDNGSAERAAGVLERGQTSGRSNADYWGLRAAVAQQLGRPTEAAAAYDQAASLRPQEGRWWMGLAIAREAAGDGVAAIDAYERALRAERFPPELVKYAQQRLAALRAINAKAR